MSARGTLVPDGRRLVVDAVAWLLAILLAGLVLAAVVGPDAGRMASTAGLVALYLVPAQVVQAVLGQLVGVRTRPVLVRALTMLGTWAVVLAAEAYLLPPLDPSDRSGSVLLLVPAGLALLTVARGGLVLVLDLDRRVARPAVAVAGPLEPVEIDPL